MPLDPQLDPHFDEAARLNNLDPLVLKALASGESSGDPNALSNKGAGGLMQFIPSTAAAYGVDDVNDPVKSIYGAARLMNDLLTNAEQQKANGRDINPLEYALKGYFAGPEGPKWKEQTAAYPGYIAGHYKTLLDQQPTSGNATVADGDMGQPYTPPASSGIDRLASVKNFTTPPGVPDRFDNETEAVINSPRPQTASAGPNTDALFNEGSQTLPNGTQVNTVSAPINGVDALRSAAQPRVVQAAPAIPSDQELLDGLREIAPMRQQPAGQATAPVVPPPTGAPAATPTGAQPAMDVQGFIDTYNKYRGFPAGVAIANSALQAITKMAPEGYILNTDGSLTLRPGMAQGKQDLSRAEAIGKAPLTAGRPSATYPQVDAAGNITGFTQAPGAPAPATVYDQSGAGHPAYMTPPSSLGGPTITPVPGSPVTKLSPQQEHGSAKAGEIAAENTPLGSNNTGGDAPSALASIKGTTLAPNMVSNIPQYKEPAYTANDIKANQGEWAKQNAEIASTIGQAQQAEQRLTSIANAFKMIQSGAFTEQKGAFNAALMAVFGKDTGLQLSNADPAAVEQALHENYKATLQSLGAVNKRFTQREFSVVSEKSEHPNLQPEANLQMLGEDIGTLRQMRTMGQDWAEARIAGLRDPEIFQTKWLSANPLPPIVDAVKQEIGPLKGMVPEGVPQGSQHIGTYQGKPVYQLPDGSRKVLQ